MEAAAEAFDVVLVEFALAAENLGDDARPRRLGRGHPCRRAHGGHEEVENFEKLGVGKLVVAVLEILDHEAQ